MATAHPNALPPPADLAVAFWRKGVVAGMELLANQLAAADRFTDQLGLPRTVHSKVAAAAITVTRNHLGVPPQSRDDAR